VGELYTLKENHLLLKFQLRFPSYVEWHRLEGRWGDVSVHSTGSI